MLLHYPGLVFDEAAHRYTVNGVELLSVTTVMKHNGLSIDYDDVNPEVLAAAGYRGTQVHHAVALYEMGDDWKNQTEQRFHGYVESYLRWRSISGYVPIYVEQPVVDTAYSYVGTLDSWGLIKGEPLLPDIKTRDLDAADGFQTAAYLEAFKQSYRLITGNPVPDQLYGTRRGGIRVYEDGSVAHLEPFTDINDLEYFRAAAVCSKLRARLGRRSPFMSPEEKELWQEQRGSFPVQSTRRMVNRSPKKRRTA